MLLNEFEMEYNDSFLININDTSLNAAGATIVSPVLMFLAGVGGNILALIILYSRRNDVRTIKFYHLIKGLVWTDLLGILFTTPSVFASYFNNRQWVGGDVHCRLHGLVMACFGMATPFIICAMAFERFLALKYVFFYSSRFTSGIAKGCILAVWIFVFTYCILPFIGFGKFEKQYPGTWCFFDFHSSKIDEKIYGYIYASINLLLILLMITCNAHVVYTLARTRFKRRYTPNRRESAVMSHMALTEQEVLVSVSRHMRKRSRDLEIHMIVFLCALTSVFTICWAPFMVHIMSTLITGKQHLLLDLAAVRLASLNQTLDPWLYILLRRSLFVALKKKVISLSNVVRCFKKQIIHILAIPNKAMSTSLIYH
ncbi:hypothetical protein DPMN_084290 [Dreissena polymorpha]|uniref:Thromboxane A2 receptor n=1 Tax=Dreissena polymorpha TaxID=45954 RepID=A0A9D3YEA1_DREPO|nr:hypothetical protein DPMN_084290 [Dreissena polymorpha]